LIRDRFRVGDELDEYAIEMPDRETGTVAARRRNAVENYLDMAKPFLAKDSVDYRKNAAGILRDGAERLAKEILVKKRREQGENCSVLDYASKTLGVLISELEPELNSSEKGDWNSIRTVLNPSNHDDELAPLQDLKMVNGWIKKFLKEQILEPAAEEHDSSTMVATTVE
jgi:hypothetical protein